MSVMWSGAKTRGRAYGQKGEWKSLSRPIASTIQPPTQLTFDKDKGSLLKATRVDGGGSSDPMGVD